MRVQIALNVPDISTAIDYYSKLFGVEPHKRKPGYANFVVNEPPLKLVLFENQKAGVHLHHIGVEVLKAEEVEAVQKRLASSDILGDVLHETRCCHAKQRKIWSKAHNGLRWEWYWVSEDVTTSEEDELGKTCCTGEALSKNIGPI